MRNTFMLSSAVSALLFASLVACGGDQQQAQNASDVPAIAPEPPPPVTAPTASNAPTDMNGPATDNQKGNTTPTGNAVGTGDQSAPTLNDGQILGITDAANKGEVDQAKMALKSGKSADVKAFAKMMVSDHTDAMKKLDALAAGKSIVTATSDDATKIQTDGQAAAGTLGSLTGKDFDKQYIDLQVTEHQQVLDALDQKLIPQSTNPDFKTALKGVRDKVAGHLKKAQEIQTKLNPPPK
ncbi:MAG TPA: DUF4142 domain-containing protein, partial [Polyangiaceae bacterium]